VSEQVLYWAAKTFQQSTTYPFHFAHQLVNELKVDCRVGFGCFVLFLLH
jgi:hypothetical protein